MLRTFIALAMALALTVANGGLADASHSWGGYHWARTANPFTLPVGDNMSGDWDGHLDTVVAAWSASGSFSYPSGATGNASNNPLRLSETAGGTDGRKCRATRGRIEACNAKYGNNGWLGLAQIWLSGGHIVQGVAKMNDSYFNTAKYNNPNEKLHVVCQEIGHTFGLGHTSENGSSQNTCMDYFSNTGTNATNPASTYPNQHDYDQLASIYSHTDSYDSFSSAGSSRSKPAWAPGFRDDGTPIGASPARGRYYVTDLPGGVRILTHIHWAD